MLAEALRNENMLSFADFAELPTIIVRPVLALSESQNHYKKPYMSSRSIQNHGKHQTISINSCALEASRLVAVLLF